jgi:hypothetical protein
MGQQFSYALLEGVGTIVEFDQPDVIEAADIKQGNQVSPGKAALVR